jgi:hypothetical protein
MINQLNVDDEPEIKELIKIKVKSYHHVQVFLFFYFIR